MRILASFVLLLACGGSQKSSETVETTEVAPAPPEEAPATQPTDDVLFGGDEVSTCDALCGQILTCAEEQQDETATDEERAQFMLGCADVCRQEAPERLTQSQACLDEAAGACVKLLPCLEQVEGGQ